MSEKSLTQVKKQLENMEKVARSSIQSCLACMAEPLLRSIYGLGAAGATAEPHKNGFRRNTPHTTPPYGLSLRWQVYKKSAKLSQQFSFFRP